MESDDNPECVRVRLGVFVLTPLTGLLPVFWPFAWMYVAYRMTKAGHAVDSVHEIAVETAPILRRRTAMSGDLEL